MARKVKSSTMSGHKGEEVDMDDVYRLGTKWYYSQIRDLVWEIKRRIKDGEITTQDGMNEAVQEEAGNNQMAIYTSQARLAVCMSDNHSAYEEAMGEPAPNVEAEAVFAIEADMMQLIDAYKSGHGEDRWPDLADE